MLSHADVAEEREEAPTIRWGVVFLVFTALGILRFASFYLDDLTRAQDGTLVRRIVEEVTGAYGSMLLFPIAVVAERWFPLNSLTWRRVLGGHVAALLIYSFAHTTLLALSRAVIFRVMGMGAYDYGRMSVRYYMEGSIDVIVYAGFLGVLSMLRTQRRLLDRERRTVALERDAARARLEALGLRLQPHFLFNALNTIASAVYESPAIADEMISRLGDLLRTALRSADRQEISVAEELQTLRAYLVFVEARFSDRLHVELEVEPAAHDAAIPTFLLQPLVENAVRHGATREFGTTTVLVSIAIRGGMTRLVVENESPLDAIDSPPLGTGLGATRERIRLLYGDAATCTTENEAGQFRVTVEIPEHRVVSPLLPVEHEEHAGAHR